MRHEGDDKSNFEMTPLPVKTPLLFGRPSRGSGYRSSDLVRGTALPKMAAVSVSAAR